MLHNCAHSLLVAHGTEGLKRPHQICSYCPLGCVFNNQSISDPRCPKISRGNYVETTRLTIHANCRLRRVFFMDRAYHMEDLLHALHDLCRGLRISSWIIVCIFSHSIDYRIETLVLRICCSLACCIYYIILYIYRCIIMCKLFVSNMNGQTLLPAGQVDIQ